ncbi:carbon-nitrogen hydrolase family protein [Actinomadura barringtoniae]|uniref:Carbon-nitrogen hydrolase family protein n=1 Tax=Actinomadura barringtoniae TaxID=1427535 RepID=A0A939PFR3_9ACTN|nr:carbon-nitrogen hydrolase family protein [Actinomadura barringtoniae]MBO2448904.1 carbon-nitrogen hydrolase family protein [Actinomadura barringtoniae]
MREALDVAVVQPVCVSFDVETNARTHASFVRAAETRLVVFPELSLTGYELDAPAIGVDDARLAPIVQACRETGAIALVGAPVQGERGAAHIGMLAIGGDRDGDVARDGHGHADGVRLAYSKMWLGGLEPQRFVPGAKPEVLEVDGWRLGLAICKDTGMPQHASDTTALGVDGNVASVCETEADAQVPDERARRVAGDHGVWVAMASFAGTTGGEYAPAAGRSGFWAADGRVIERAGPETGAIVRARFA